MTIPNSNGITNDNKQQSWIEAGKTLLDHGFSIIAVGKNKKPLFSWKKYQNKKTGLKEVEQWASQDGFAGFAVVTGKISNLFVLDIDNGADTNGLVIPKTVSVETGSGGKHYYFRYPKDIELKNSGGFRKKMDTRGEGGYVICPPSLHPSGNIYKWINGLETEIADVPKWLLKELQENKKSLADWAKSDVLKGVSESKRNETATKIVGMLLSKFPKDKWEETVWPLLQGWNLKNTPPLDEGELRSVYESIAGKEASKKDSDEMSDEEGGGKQSVAEKLAIYALDQGIEVFLDQMDEPHLVFPGQSANAYPIKSAMFKRWLAGIYWAEEEKGFSGETFSGAASILEGKAFHDNIKNTLFNRVAYYKECIYYDLGNNVDVVEISRKGWRVINQSPVIFRKFKHQLVQVKPVEGGDFSQVLKYINIYSENDKLLFLTYLVTVLVPNIPRVISIFVGDQGSAKSTAQRVVRSLVDPSLSELLSPPRDINELAQNANHHYCLFLDNLSSLSESMSDVLCRLVTGIGFSKRKLFTDDEDILFNQKVAVGMSGINLVAEKSDLLDRSLIIRFNAISEVNRVDESAFWQQFNKEKGMILGALFDTLSDTLRIAPNLRLSSKPRMADYAIFAAAAAEAMGLRSDDFLKAFEQNINRQNQAAIESSPTAQAIIKFMEDNNQWGGSSSLLHKNLVKIAEDQNLKVGGVGGFPKSSNWLWKRIKQVRPNLLALGIDVAHDEDNTGSLIEMSKVSQSRENTATTTTSKELASYGSGGTQKGDEDTSTNTATTLQAQLLDGDEAGKEVVAAEEVNEGGVEAAEKTFGVKATKMSEEEIKIHEKVKDTALAYKITDGEPEVLLFKKRKEKV